MKLAMKVFALYANIFRNCLLMVTVLLHGSRNLDLSYRVQNIYAC